MESCYRELNSGPLPYQGSALPLSYNSEFRAENGAQTRDPQLGRLVLYQLSYFRNTELPYFREVGGDGFEPPKSKDNRFTVCPIWPLWKPPSMFLLLISASLTIPSAFFGFRFPSLLSDSNQRPRDYKSRALAN